MHAVIDTSNSEFPRYWDRLVANDPLQNPLYAPPRGQSGRQDTTYSDRSFLVMADDEPVFGCSLTLHTDARGRRCLGYFGIEASTLVNHRSMKKPSNCFSPEAIRLLQEHFSQLIEELRPDALDYLDPVACGLLSPLTQLLLARGATPVLYKARRINLALSEQAMWRLVSEPYRELIQWGREHLDLELCAGIDIDAVTTRIPQLIARRGNEPGQSTLAHWHTCRELVRQGNGFIVQARQAGEDTASAVFVHNQKTCHYIVDDSLLDVPRRPLLHSMIWHAIVHSKKLGCAQFDLGCTTRNISAEDEAAAALAIDPEHFGGTPQTRLKVSLVQ